MEIEATQKKGAVVIAVSGRIDAVTAPEMEKTLRDWMAKGETRFVLNFSRLEYISSAGLRAILAAGKQLKSKEGRMVFYGLRGSVKEVFKISGFETVFQVFETEEEALVQV